MTREDDVEEDDELSDDHDEAGSGQYVQHHEVTAFLFILFPRFSPKLVTHLYVVKNPQHDFTVLFIIVSSIEEE